MVKKFKEEKLELKFQKKKIDMIIEIMIDLEIIEEEVEEVMIIEIVIIIETIEIPEVEVIDTIEIIEIPEVETQEEETIDQGINNYQ